MKFFSALLLFVCLSASADSISVIINGNPGGTFYTRSEMYISGLEQKGYTVNIINRPKNAAAGELFLTMTDPVLMVWMDALAAIRNLQANQDNFVAIEYSAPLFLCSISGNNSGFIGAPKMYIMDPVLSMIPGSKIVPYKNTGATLNAAIAGEIDFAYINQGSAKKLLDAGYACKVVPGVAQHAIVLARNTDIEKLRDHILQIQQNVEFQNWLSINEFEWKELHSTREEELKKLNESEDRWIQAAN